MNGGLYRSAHAAPDGGARVEDGVTLISVDPPLPGAAPVQDQALPPEEVPADAGGTAGNSAVMAVGSLVSRVIGFVRNALIGMTLGAGIGDAYTSAQFLPGRSTSCCSAASCPAC